jgi:hypothetical protein
LKTWCARAVANGSHDGVIKVLTRHLAEGTGVVSVCVSRVVNGAAEVLASELPGKGRLTESEVVPAAAMTVPLRGDRPRRREFDLHTGKGPHLPGGGLNPGDTGQMTLFRVKIDHGWIAVKSDMPVRRVAGDGR